MDAADVARLTEALERFAACADKLEGASNTGNQSVNNVTVGEKNAMAAAVMLGLNLGLVAIIVSLFNTNMEQDRRIDDMQHYINATYMMAPALQKFVEEHEKQEQ